VRAIDVIMGYAIYLGVTMVYARCGKGMDYNYK